MPSAIRGSLALGDREIHITKDDKYHHINITDNGIGIEGKYMADLFTPFKKFHNTSEYEGSGLSMSICMKIMQNHNGELQLKGTSDNGSTFQIAFPKEHSNTESFQENHIGAK